MGITVQQTQLLWLLVASLLHFSFSFGITSSELWFSSKKSNYACTTRFAASQVSIGSDPSVTSLLDGEQEIQTARRAYEEEKILENSPSLREDLVMPTEEERKQAVKWIKNILRSEKRSGAGGIAKGGGGGGFGKTSQITKKSPSATGVATFNPSIDTHGYGAIIQKNGVVRIDNVLSKPTAEVLRDYLDELKNISEAEVENGTAPQLSRFTRVLLKKDRWDLLLPYDPPQSTPITRALKELLLSPKDPIPSAITSILGPDAELYELACLISDPGSDRQVVHPDIAHQGDVRNGPLLTCFIALQDISREMGPTEFLPGTNTAEAHAWCNDRSCRDEELGRAESRLNTLCTGDCSLFDATTLHCGTANRSQERRRLFYFTFRSQSMKDPRTSNNPGSIRPDVKDRHLTLEKIRNDLKDC